MWILYIISAIINFVAGLIFTCCNAATTKEEIDGDYVLDNMMPVVFISLCGWYFWAFILVIFVAAAIGWCINQFFIGLFKSCRSDKSKRVVNILLEK